MLPTQTKLALSPASDCIKRRGELKRQPSSGRMIRLKFERPWPGGVKRIHTNHDLIVVTHGSARTAWVDVGDATFPVC